MRNYILITISVAIIGWILYRSKKQTISTKETVPPIQEADIEYDVIPRERPEEPVFNGNIGNDSVSDHPVFDGVYLR